MHRNLPTHFLSHGQWIKWRILFIIIGVVVQIEYWLLPNVLARAFGITKLIGSVISSRELLSIRAYEFPYAPRNVYLQIQITIRSD